MLHRYLHYDVFTREALAGNQLAVFLDGRDLQPARMQAIAREMAFSETTFILPREDPDTDVRMRIFTPGAELPAAGHPTIGSAFALAAAGVIQPGASGFVFGLGIGPVPVSLEWSQASNGSAEPLLRFAWMTQPNPKFGTVIDDIQAVAVALGVRRDDIDAALPIQEVTCGLPFLFVPMASRASVDSAVSDASAMRRLAAATGVDLPIFLFSREAGEPEATVYSRMFAPQFGIAEDPATGIASGPLGSYLVHHRLISEDAAQHIVSLQGVAMGRTSRIHIAITSTRGQVAQVRVGGEAVLVARGELLV
jgi:trans-2,3-dihydro-3-hydroxyanthranilate isomerase